MDADAVIDDVKRRLLAMAQDPPFRFRRTSRAAAESYMREMTAFRGCPDSEIVAAEAALGVQFTDVFRAYLRRMGRSRGQLFCGSDVALPSQFGELREFGQGLMHETSESLQLPDDAIIFLTHQGYQFLFIRPHGGFDCPVLNYIETEDAPTQSADSFAALLDAELRLMEDVHRQAHASGGHYVTVHPGGATSFEYPARSSGDRATSRPFKLGD